MTPVLIIMLLSAILFILFAIVMVLLVVPFDKFAHRCCSCPNYKKRIQFCQRDECMACIGLNHTTDIDKRYRFILDSTELHPLGTKSGVDKLYENEEKEVIELAVNKNPPKKDPEEDNDDKEEEKAEQQEDDDDDYDEEELYEMYKTQIKKPKLETIYANEGLVNDNIINGINTSSRLSAAQTTTTQQRRTGGIRSRVSTVFKAIAIPQPPLSADLFVHLNQLWRAWIVMIRKYPSFKRQTDVLKEYDHLDFVNNLQDYEKILAVVSKISKLKIYSHDTLAERFISNLGFYNAYQLDDDNGQKILSAAVEIYEEIKKIESQPKQKQNKVGRRTTLKNFTFIRFSMVKKYDDEFIDNEDNVIGNFSPRANKDSSTCDKDIESCQYVTRIMHALSVYSRFDLQNEADQDKMVIYFEDEYMTLLDDHIHFNNSHAVNQRKLLENAYHLFCDVQSCGALLRYYNEQKEDVECDEEVIFYRDIMDSLHCSIYHPYKMDFGITKQFSEEVDDGRRYSKFNIEWTQEQTFMEGLCEHLKDKGIKQDMIQDMLDICREEEYDSDAIIQDFICFEDDQKTDNTNNMSQLLPKCSNQMESFVNLTNGIVYHLCFCILYIFYI